MPKGEVQYQSVGRSAALAEKLQEFDIYGNLVPGLAEYLEETTHPSRAHWGERAGVGHPLPRQRRIHVVREAAPIKPQPSP